MKLYMFRAVPLPIIGSLFTVHSALVYVIQVWRQLSSRSICSCSKAVFKPLQACNGIVLPLHSSTKFWRNLRSSSVNETCSHWFYRHRDTTVIFLKYFTRSAVPEGHDISSKWVIDSTMYICPQIRRHDIQIDHICLHSNLHIFRN